MTTRITVTPQSKSKDLTSTNLVQKAKKRGYDLEEVICSTITLIDDQLSTSQLEEISQKILADPITENYRIGKPQKGDQWIYCHIFPIPGVTNPSEETLIKALNDIGIESHKRPRIGKEYAIKGLNVNQIEQFAKTFLYNPVIETCHINLDNDFPLPPTPTATFELKSVPLNGLNDQSLTDLSKQGQLALDLDEMKTIQNYYQKLGREPTDIELETIAQTWSEHCCHKTLTCRVDTGERVIDNILKSTIKASTDQLNKDWCLSVFKDNAGVIAFDDEDGISFKVETHNHPSAIEPYGGAGTGLGGCIRDTLGTGCGAKPIANTDVFCFAPLTTQDNELPPGVLPPRHLMESVVAGVRDYGNKMGIPTVNGAVCFDPDYVGNPLVFCGSVGIIPKKYVSKKVEHGDLIVAIGGRTGRDGIHGATFSSIELDEGSQEHSSGAVQIGNPIIEKMCLDVLLKARDLDLIRAVTDCGAGGFSSAIGEMGEEIGARVNLDKAPLKYPGLNYWEIWISEAQERMVLAIAPKNIAQFLSLCQEEDVEAVVLGEFGNDTQELILMWHDHEVGRLSMEFLHHGRPSLTRQARIAHVNRIKGTLPQVDHQECLFKLLQMPNIASKEWIIRQYDHEVQAGSIIKPLVGQHNDGPSDAAIIAPKLGSDRGVVISNGINPHYGRIDPYAMTAACVDEALRNIIAVGGNLKQCALLDNFSWGNTSQEEGLGSILRAAEACHDAALGYGTPFISGKDSLNNEFRTNEKLIVIPDTILISAFSVMEDIKKSISMDLKTQQSIIYLVGLTRWELGGSHFNLILDQSEDTTVPQTDYATNLKTFNALSKATEQQLILSAHDLSEGGLAVCAAEMAFAGGIGMAIDVSLMPTDDSFDASVRLFSESTGRFLIEVNQENSSQVEEILSDIPHARLGNTNHSQHLTIKDKNQTLIDCDLEKLKQLWKSPLDLDSLS